MDSFRDMTDSPKIEKILLKDLDSGKRAELKLNHKAT